METLPSEIITSIMTYLSFEDRRQMGLVNKTWYYAFLHPILLNKEVLVYYNLMSICDCNDSAVIQKLRIFEQVLMDSKRTLFHLRFNCSSLNDVIIFEKLGDRIISLDLMLNCFSDSNLDSITNYCVNLQTLQLRGIDIITMVVKSSRKLLVNLNSLTIISCRLSDMSFNAIVQCAPNLIDICIDCNSFILEWPQSIRRYYPNYKNSEISTCFNSDSVFTSVNILNYFKNAKNIKKLKLSHHLIFSNLPKHIKLKTLILDMSSPNMNTKSCDSLVPPNSNIHTFILALTEQTSLERLQLYYTSCLVLMAVLKLHNIKYLEFEFAMGFNCENGCFETFFSSLWKMKYIETFIFSLNLIPPNCNKGIVAEIPDCTLKSLTTLDCPLENSLKIIQLGNRLTTLKIKIGHNLLAHDLQLLFNNLTNLMHLSIDKCVHLNDDVFLSLPISNIKGLVSLKIQGANLSYRCLQNIKLSYLQILSIKYLSEIPDMESDDYSNFQDIFEKFAHSVPALTNLNLEDIYCPNNKRKINTECFRPFFSKIKLLSIYC